MKIKRLLYLAVITVITLGISNNSVAQKVSHTFVVDGNLPAPKEKFSSTKGDVIASVWANEEKTGKVIATSWGEDNMYYPGRYKSRIQPVCQSGSRGSERQDRISRRKDDSCCRSQRGSLFA